MFVSHDMFSVERFCDRAMLMERGEMIEIGPPPEIARAYHKLNFGELPHEASPGLPAQTGGTAIVEAWFENSTGERVTTSSREDALTMCFEAQIAEDLEDPVFAATLRNELGHTIVVARSDQQGSHSGRFSAGEVVAVRFAMPNWLSASRYTLTPSIAREGTGADALALVEDMASVMIHGAATGGILELPINVRIDRV